MRPAPRREILETLYWPLLPCGIAGRARRSPHEWFMDLAREQPHARLILFQVDDVLDRFKLCVHADGSFWTDPPHVREWPGITFITDQGDTGDSLDELVANCVDSNPSWMYPLEYNCRVAITRRERYRWDELTGLEKVGNGCGAKFEHRLDR